MEVEFGESILADPATCRCFVTHYDRMADWRDLVRFGASVVPMFAGKTVFPDQAERSEATLPAAVLDVLIRRKFDPTKDYLILAGDIVIQAVCVAMVASRFGSFTALRFDKREQRYWPYRVDIQLKVSSKDVS